MTPEIITALAAELSVVVREHAEAAVAPLVKRIAELEAREAIPGPPGDPGKDGAAGADGRDGADGKDGRDGVDGKDGASGVDGRAGADGKDGQPGKDGAPGRDGVGVKGFLIGRDGNLVATMSDGATIDLGVVVGRDGAPGRDGADGLGFDDVGSEQIDHRSFKIFFARGNGRREFVFDVPTPVDCGVFREGETYRPGDGVTWGGSWWICQTETTDKPETSKAWRLAVKRGRDGRDGKDGDRGPEGKQGAPGRDLTQLAADGTKY